MSLFLFGTLVAVYLIGLQQAYIELEVFGDTPSLEGSEALDDDAGEYLPAPPY